MSAAGYYAMPAPGAAPGAPAPTTRFTPADFKYNGRVALALLPCLATVATIGGASVLSCLTVGAMVVYLMDALQYREGAFTCAWLTLAAADVAFTMSLLTTSDAPVALQICMIFSMLFLSVLTGMWASLQFKWLQMQYPAAAIYFERCVLTASLPLAGVVHCLGLATFVPYSDVPYYLAVVLVALYYMLGRPLMSSFYNVKAGPAALGGGPAVGPEAVVQTRADGALMAALVAFLPVATYAAVHWVVVTFPLHLYSVLLLAGGMPLCLALLPGGLWWLAPAVPAPVNAARSAGGGGAADGPNYGCTPYIATPSRGLAGLLRKAILAAALLVALVGFEGRVVFHGFGQYIQLPPPWNWLAVTFALFGCAVVLLLHLTGALGASVDVTVAGSFLLLCTTAGSLAAGVPFVWLPAPLLAACGLSLFYESRSLREYMVFVVGAFFTCVWFMRQHFWFLDILVSGMRLHTLCKLAVAALVPALTVPGLVIARVNPHIVGGLLVMQAVLVCVMEERLYAAGHEDGAPETMYPGYLVLATSLVGLAAARLLTGRGRLTPLASWLLHSLYLAKASMLIIPEADLVTSATLLAAAAIAPYFFHGPSWLHNTPAGAAGGSLLDAAAAPAAAAAAAAAAGASRPRRLRLAPWQGLAHFLAILVCVCLARFAVFDVVQFLISARPTEGLLLGCLALTLAAALLPLAGHCYGGAGPVARAAAAVGLVGALLVMLQPPMPLAGGARCPRLPLSLCPRLWDERHVPMHSAEDVEVWGRGLSRREHWPRWLLIAAVVAGLATTGGGAGGPAAVLSAPRRASMVGRLALAGGAGLLVGTYTALELLPQQVPLQILVVAASVVAVIFVVLLSLPRAGGAVALPALGVLWGTCSGLALLLQAELPVHMDRANARLFPDSKVQVEREIYRATKASLLAVVASHALLMAFALKLKMTSALRRRAAAAAAGRDHANGGGASGSAVPSFGISPSDLLCGVVPNAVFSNYCAMLKLEGAGALALQRLAGEGLSWVPTLGNLLTLAAAALGVALNAFLNGGLGAPEAIFMLAPVLLLLSQDPLILPGLSERQRYCPPQLAISAYLLLSGLMVVVGDVVAGGGAAAAVVGLPPVLYLVKEVGLAALAVPHHLLFLRYLWTHHAASWGTALLVSAPVCLLPAVMCDVPALRFFGAVGAVVAVLQYFSMKHVRHVGMKVI
ncbi:hypothetical protein PLESTB_001193000 [Pleodorina starrii]|uniref:No exine formation 1 n=1 Tax=Pleodorina starrii TaxID=330485 RepID=A0A9W6BS05_9CHLO|nr:hypothetical protein PLESTM_001830300 [Pleodorina starrii]GLC57152.1 hypothetical protein PLESTB_001193000 [Pleodorina starrii]GLC71465.1 hypothetical protein PLESTF_001118800 [Pleodorina starrii]